MQEEMNQALMNQSLVNQTLTGKSLVGQSLTNQDLVNQGLANKTISVIDLGSNSIRMIIVRVLPHGATSLLNQVKHMVQLGQGAFLENTLQDDAMERTMNVIVSLAQICKSYNVTDVIAIATAAVRDAKNGQSFIEEVYENTGIQFTCISGQEEARLIYRGVSEEFEKSSTLRLYLDIGGGSTEFVVGDSYSHIELDSVKMGCVRLANMFVKGDTGKISEKQYATMQNYVRGIARHTFGRMASHHSRELIASSGTAQHLALMAAYLEFGTNKPEKAELRLTYKGLCRIVKLLCSCNEEERKNIMGINPRRIDVLIPGAAILQTVMEELQFDSLRTSPYGLRDGILRDYLEKNFSELALENISIQEKSVLKLARFCHFEEAHARYVGKLALDLFDSSKKCKLHNMDNSFRNLLFYASLLHDIGIFISFSKHDEHGKYLIKHHPLLGFTNSEISILAYLVATHRMKGNKNVFELGDFSPEMNQQVEKLSILLKFAEALEQSHGKAVREAFFIEKGKVLELVIKHTTPCLLEQEKIEQGKKFFKKFTNKDVCVRWVPDYESLHPSTF